MTRLVELSPIWLERNGQRIGFTFLCPCCKKDRLTCFLDSPPFKEQVAIMHAAFHTTPEDEHDWPINWVPSKAGVKWSMSNLDNFDTMTVQPSIDASASGNWHGFIKNGEIQ